MLTLLRRVGRVKDSTGTGEIKYKRKAVIDKIEQPQYSPNNSRQLMGLTVLKNNHKDIRRLKKAVGESSHHGNKVWNASLMLMEYFKHEPPATRSRIIEVGCGWGITGIYCAKQFDCQVTGLDIDKTVLPFMHHHAQINQVQVEGLEGRYEKLTSKKLLEYDCLIGGDICFWDDLSVPLYNLVRRAHKAGVRVVLSDPGRPPFLAMAEAIEAKLGGIFSGWHVPAPYNCSGYILDLPPA